MATKITDLPQNDTCAGDIKMVIVGECHRPVTNRTNDIARLFKFFTFPIDYLESVLDFYRGDINLAFRFLNDQAKSDSEPRPLVCMTFENLRWKGNDNKI